MRFFFYLFIALNISASLQAQVSDADIDVKGEHVLACPGDIDIEAANDAICPGSVNITGGDASGFISGGNVNITSGGSPSQTGNINIKTASGDNFAGDISIETANSNGLAAHILISSGWSSIGGDGITLQTGGSSGSANDINIICGYTFEGSDISLTAGDGENGGNINLTPGDGNPFSDGLVKIWGSGCYTGSWGLCSDRRFKKNINDLEGSLNSVLQLRGVSFEYKTDEFPENKFNEGKQIGLIAQEVEKVFPEFVMTDEEGYKSVAYQNMVTVLIEAIKEQQKQIESLTGRIETLENEISGEVVEVSSLNK